MKIKRIFILFLCGLLLVSSPMEALAKTNISEYFYSGLSKKTSDDDDWEDDEDWGDEDEDWEVDEGWGDDEDEDWVEDEEETPTTEATTSQPIEDDNSEDEEDNSDSNYEDDEQDSNYEDDDYEDENYGDSNSNGSSSNITNNNDNSSSTTNNNSQSSGNNGVNIINYGDYCNFYINTFGKKYHAYIYSLNNKDSGAYYRPKYKDIQVPIGEQAEFKDREITIHTNGFDIGHSSIDKSNLPTSRALQKLGYDFLLYKESVQSNGTVDRIQGYNTTITAPYFIMNIYKALGIELYDVYYKFEKGEENVDCGVYVTRTNPESYWKLFLNDHPIDYKVYNDDNVNNISAGQVLTVADAISILSQMLDFYGEPALSKKEEYTLLQIYADDVPSTLSDNLKEAWSYLKCRGIIGESEYNYDQKLTFNTMMELLLRASDEDSRTNFKEIQITTNLDSSFINNGYYETDSKIVNQVPVTPLDIEVVWNQSKRIDLLIEFNSDTKFKFKDSGKATKNLFISKGPNYNDKAIPGSVFEGIVKKKYYHFSVPRSQLNDITTLYINSSKSGDYPLNYKITSTDGGVYTSYTVTNKDTVKFSKPKTFDSMFPKSVYVDKTRIEKGSQSVAKAANNNVTYKVKFDTELLNTNKSIKVIEKIGGKAEVKKVNGKEVLVVTAKDGDIKGVSSSDSLTDVISRRLVVKDKYKYESTSGSSAILSLTGDRLLVSLKKAVDIKAVKGYKAIPDKDILIIYTEDNDVVIVDNKNKIIQKGNTYLQINEQQPLFIIKNGEYTVDFRALYGSKSLGFIIDKDSSTGESTITLFNNSLSSKDSNNKNVDYRVNSYIYESILQYGPFSSTVDTNPLNVKTDILFEFEENPTKKDRYNIKEAWLPFSSTNALGNYLIYGEYNSSYSEENYYLVLVTPKKIASAIDTNSKLTYKKIFKYHPTEIPKDYAISIIKLENNNNYGIKYIDGVGWCYKLDILKNTKEARKSYMNGIINKKNIIPFALSKSSNGIINLINFNINYINDDITKNLKTPNQNAYTGIVPAAVGLQSWFTNPDYVSTLSYKTLESYVGSSKVPSVYYGTLKCEVTSGKLITNVGSIDLTNLTKENDFRIQGIPYLLKGYKGENSWKNTGIYMVTTSNFETTLSTEKEALKDNTVTKKATALQEFFDQFEGITLLNFLYALDNSMSIAYFLITRAVPLIIVCLLVLLLLISMISDIKLFQIFCDRVVDPVKLITFNNFTVHDVRNDRLILSLIIAMAIMGVIQAGNLEKIIMFIVECYYSIISLFG